MKKGRFVILLVIILLISTINLVFDMDNVNKKAEAGSIYVDSAGSGNYTTIQAAINAANPGDTIYVWAGIYNESIIVNKTLTIIGNGTGNTTITSTIYYGDVLRITEDFVNISGFTIKGTGSNNFNAAIRLDRVINCTVNNNVLRDNRYGLYLSRGSGHTILNNTFMNNNRGIYAYMSNSNIIMNNTLSSNIDSGIYLYFSNQNSIIENDCSNNSRSIYLYYSDSNNIENNICDSNSPGDISVNQDSNFNKIANNTCNGITLQNSGSNKVFNNTIGPTGITINGNQLEHWNQTLDLNNTMNGKAIIYWYNQSNRIVPTNAGQVILIYCENITVKDCNFSDIQTAIMLSFSKNVFIHNNTGTNLTNFIYLSSSDNNNIENNIYNPGNTGRIILEVDSKSNVLANNTCGSITLDYSGNNTVLNNSLLFAGLSIQGDQIEHWIHKFDLNNTVKNEIIFYMYNITNKILPLGGGQVILINCRNITVENQNFSDKGSGILLGFSNNNKIKNNTCLNNTEAINLWNSDNNIIRDNLFLNTSNSGFMLTESNFNKIVNNTINYNSLYGIRLMSSNSNTISDNICNLNHNDGIYLSQSDSNTISDNICNFNQNDGIYLSQSNSNTFVDNICNLNQGNGIYLTWAEANVINSNVCNFNEINGMRVSECKLTIISNDLCQSNKNHGIYIYSSENTDIRDTISKNNTGDGINLDYYSNYYNTITIIKNQFVNNVGNGINSIMTEDSTFQENDCSNNNLSGIRIYGAKVGYEQIPHGINNSVENNTCTKNNQSGITIIESNKNKIKNNSCSENKVNGIEDLGERDAVNWLGAHNIFSDNTCNLNQLDGIYFWDGAFCTVNNNNVYQNTRHGLNFQLSMKNEIIGNNIFNNVNGIDFDSSEYTDISNNLCRNNDYNLFFMNSSSNKVIYNNFSSGSYGIFLYSDCDSNIIFENTIADNTNTGIILSLDCNTNRIYYNQILTNTNQAEEINSQFNIWNNNIEQGNYWSDYAGLDNGAEGRDAGDGIGDTNLPHLGLDDYPFLIPSGWLYPGIPILLDPGDLDSDGNYTITWLEPRNTFDYILQESTDELFSSPTTIYEGTQLQYNVTNSVEGTFYYRIKANNFNFSSDWSNIVNIEINFPPKIPENFAVSVKPAGNILNISWKALDETDVTEYYLYYKHTELGTWKLLTVNQHPLNYYEHTGLINGETYFYRLRINDTYGHISNYSSAISGIPLDSMAPDSPTGLLILETTINSISLKWNSSLADDVVGYYIYRSLVSNPENWGEPINGKNLYSSIEYTDKGLEELTTYYYIVTAVDEVPLESDFSLEISGTTILGEYGPIIIAPQKDFEILEDTIDNSTINLFEWFSDPNDDDLTFECKGNVHIAVTIIDDTGEVILTPEPNWNGKENLVFFAYDADNYTHDEVVVTVKPVNDPPGQAQITNPDEGHKVNDSTPIRFEGSCPDVDLPNQDEHVYIWSSNISGNLGSGRSFITIIKDSGYHLITLIVTDSGGLGSKATINVTITKSPIPETPEQPHENETIDDDGEEEDDSWFLTTAIITGILIVILILVLFIALRKKPERAVEKEIADEEAEASDDVEEKLTEDSLHQQHELEEAELEEFECSGCGEMLLTGETVCPECGTEFGKESKDEVSIEVPPEELESEGLDIDIDNEGIEPDEVQAQTKEP